MISVEAETAGKFALDAEIEARRIERQLRDLKDELGAAEQTLEAIDLESEERLYIAVELVIENLTDQTWQLEVRDSVPYSQQEDLQITWSATPTPRHPQAKKIWTSAVEFWPGIWK